MDKQKEYYKTIQDRVVTRIIVEHLFGVPTVMIRCTRRLTFKIYAYFIDDDDNALPCGSV